MRASRYATTIRRVTLDSTFAMLVPATGGHCPVCLAPLKWVEIGHVDHPDGSRAATRLLVCKNSHQTVVVEPPALR
jgi:hypothetical protein